jgi:hypothetical protein
MPEEVTPSAEGSTESTPANVVPDDFAGYVKWRTTGESEAVKEEPAASAAAETDARTTGTEAQAETAPDSEPEDTQEPVEDEIEGEDRTRPKRPGSWQRRIDKLTYENEELKRKLEDREKQPPPKEKAAALPPDAPKLEDFETLEQFQWAVSKYLHEQTRAEELKAREIERVQSEWDTKENKARKAHTDYDEVIGSVRVPKKEDGSELPGAMAARHAMLDDETGAEVLYYLAQRPKELQRIAHLDPIRAVMEIGRLSATVSRSSEVPDNVPRMTSAPKPPPPVGRPSRTSSDDIYDDAVNKDFRRYEKARIAQLRNS